MNGKKYTSHAKVTIYFMLLYKCIDEYLSSLMQDLRFSLRWRFKSRSSGGSKVLQNIDSLLHTLHVATIQTTSW